MHPCPAYYIKICNACFIYRYTYTGINELWDSIINSAKISFFSFILDVNEDRKLNHEDQLV